MARARRQMIGTLASFMRLLAMCSVAIGLISAACLAQGKKKADEGTSKVAAPEHQEIVEADVSSREIAVTSGFTGKEIIVFGAIHNSREIEEEGTFYDVVVTVEGAARPLVLRRKSNVAGLWMNTSSVHFDRVPSFYALSSTRPLDKIASPAIFADLGIGFSHIRITPRHSVDRTQFADYRNALIRLKKKEKIYLQDQTGVAFIGQSLFRSSVTLPANVPVGQLQARVYLFFKGQLLSSYTASLQLEREGVERWLHRLAHQHGFLYGLLAVITAMSAGLLAFEVTRRRAG